MQYVQEQATIWHGLPSGHCHIHISLGALTLQWLTTKLKRDNGMESNAVPLRSFLYLVLVPLPALGFVPSRIYNVLCAQHFFDNVQYVHFLHKSQMKKFKIHFFLIVIAQLFSLKATGFRLITCWGYFCLL